MILSFKLIESYFNSHKTNKNDGIVEKLNGEHVNEWALTKYHDVNSYLSENLKDEKRKKKIKESPNA